MSREIDLQQIRVMLDAMLENGQLTNAAHSIAQHLGIDLSRPLVVFDLASKNSQRIQIRHGGVQRTFDMHLVRMTTSHNHDEPSLDVWGGAFSRQFALESISLELRGVEVRSAPDLLQVSGTSEQR